jgi:hypothetical protein
MSGLDTLLSLSPAVLVGLGALIVLDVVLDVVCFVDLYKRPVDQLLIPNKWIFAAIILVVTTFGAIFYLAVGRKPAPAAEARQQTPVSARASGAVDLLYGKRKDGGKS